MESATASKSTTSSEAPAAMKAAKILGWGTLEHLVLKGSLVAKLTSCTIDTKIVRRDRLRSAWTIGQVLDTAAVGAGTVGNVLPSILQIVCRWTLDGGPAAVRVFLPLAVVLAIDVAIPAGVDVSALASRHESMVALRRSPLRRSAVGVGSRIDAGELGSMLDARGSP